MNAEVNIADHILIGNCRTAALISKNGSIDWCCIPEFHSPSIFAAILDDEKGGFFSIQPINQFQSSQTYIADTNVAELIFENEEGTVKLTDCFVAMEEEDKQAELFPDHEIVRIVEGISGSVTLRIDFLPRTYYGKHAVKLKDYKKLGVHFTYRENICVFQSTLANIHINDDKERISAECIVNKGERVIFSLACSTQYPAIIPEIKLTAIKRLENTIAYWRKWISKCRYDGMFKQAVLRSALALKLLTHAPSGAIVAAPTTSLPESIGGVRNWDYRFCWLRDASFTIRVLIDLGFYDEAHAYMSWILHATQLTRPKLQVVYTVFGHSRLNTKNCNWLKGYKNSKPVRIGNDAHRQFQLDVYGEVLDAVFTYSRIVEKFDKNTANFIIGLGKTICKYWNLPDDGIWEISTGKHHTHSKVMAWVGLDRLIKLCERYKWSNCPVEEFEQVRQKLKSAIEKFGFRKDLNSYVREFDSKNLDAALLTFSLVDYCDARSPGMRETVNRIQASLSEQGFVYRHLDIDPGLYRKEGAFIVASYWLVENLAKMGKSEEAIKLFNATIADAPAHGLLAEEIEPATKEWLGNFPQGFSHIGLINAALTITKAEMNHNRL